jgi:hypothetical protein
MKGFGPIPHRSTHWPLVVMLPALCPQIAPIVPVSPTMPSRKCCAIYNLRFLSYSMAWKGLEEPANETFTRPHERLSRARCRDQFLPRSGLQDRTWSKVSSSCARPLKEGPWLESCLSSQFETIPSGLRHLFKNPKIKPLSGDIVWRDPSVDRLSTGKALFISPSLPST